MIYLPDDKMFANKFIFAQLPTKAQIFSRTGQRAVSPSGMFTKDDSADFGKTPTMSAAEFLKDAEAYEESKSDAE